MSKNLNINNHLKRLNEQQVQSFDTEYVNNDRFAMVTSQIDKNFPDGKFTFADFGGGNGIFTDRLLGKYPDAKAILIDNSEYLISINKQDERKTIICDSVENAAKYVKQVDIVFLNWLLHHLVSKSRKKTCENIIKILKIASKVCLKKVGGEGHISIFENMYDGYLFTGLPSYLIFYLTSSKILAPITRRLGANTAGCGVCFMSKNQWHKILNKAGLSVESYKDDITWEFSAYKKLLLHLGNVRVGHLWVK